MPIYEYECKCGRGHEGYRKVDERHLVPQCICGEQMTLMISRPANTYCSGYPYYDTILETQVNDPAHRKRLLKENKLDEAG